MLYLLNLKDPIVKDWVVSQPEVDVSRPFTVKKETARLFRAHVPLKNGSLTRVILSEGHITQYMDETLSPDMFV